MLASDSGDVPTRPRGLVVIGASAGGVETLRRIVSGLPPDLPAAVCIVLHLAPDSPSALAGILSRSGPLPCHTALDGEPLIPGQILVAAPGHHLVIDAGHVRLTLGPRENGHRPAVNVLFRTAAAAGDGGVVGVVLSGTRDDGATGLAVIKEHGGATIVQDPEEALYGGMPSSALAHVDVDVVAPSREIAAAVVRAVTGTAPQGPHRPADASPERLRSVHRERGDRRPAGGSGSLDPGGEQESVAGMTATESGVLSVCPECGGILSEIREAGTIQWHCRVGHRYGVQSLLDGQANNVESALWTAVRVLEDRRVLLERLAERLEGSGTNRSASALRRQARAVAEQAQLVRSALADAALAAIAPGVPIAAVAAVGALAPERAQA
jgi:two-component system chemotaxis response regulator CheB